MRKMVDCECGIVMPKKGDPIIDIRGLFEYCDKNNIDRTNGAPYEVVEKFIIGYRN